MGGISFSKNKQLKVAEQIIDKYKPALKELASEMVRAGYRIGYLR